MQQREAFLPLMQIILHRRRGLRICFRDPEHILFLKPSGKC